MPSVIWRRQHIRAQSSTDAEVFVASVGMSTCKSFSAWLSGLARERLRLESAAFLLRVGVGRTRHLEVIISWVPDWTRSGLVAMEQCVEARNVSAIGAEPMCSSVSERHWEALRLLRPS